MLQQGLCTKLAMSFPLHAEDHAYSMPRSEIRVVLLAVMIPRTCDRYDPLHMRPAGPPESAMQCWKRGTAAVCCIESVGCVLLMRFA